MNAKKVKSQHKSQEKSLAKGKMGMLTPMPCLMLLPLPSVPSLPFFSLLKFNVQLDGTFSECSSQLLSLPLDVLPLNLLESLRVESGGHICLPYET